MTIANQILGQLGGNKFIAMTGATCFSDNNTLIAKFKGSKIANIMYITLNSMDLYDVRICKFKGCEVKEVANQCNVYNEDLKSYFEKITGLRVSL